MADSGSYTRFLNFWKLHCQKMGLELKCSLCLNMLNRPMLLPCDHLFCRTCIPNSAESGSECPICFRHYIENDLRNTPHMENILNIFKSMEATLNTIPFQSAVQADAIGGQLSEYHNHGSSLNQTTQPSPCTTPSFGETKDSDDDCNNPGGEHNVKTLSAKGTTTKEIEVGKVAKSCGRPSTGSEDDHARETKRQKLEFGLQGRASNGEICIQYEKLDPDNSLYSNSEIGHKLKTGPVGAQSPLSGNLYANQTFVCAFCQSSEVSEVYGPMLHYKEGKPVEVDKLTQPGVVHVHRRCVEWTPQAYYDGETVINLESELARAAKLKCNQCKLKGAGLGCYAKSCRKSFHAPCAVYIDECRWDTEDFLMLCPTHSSYKFPNEKSKSKKKREENLHSNDETASQKPDKVWAASPGTSKSLVICGSDLSPSEKSLLFRFGKISGATVSKVWDPTVTHVIAATDEKGAFCRTLKVLMGILNGRWILSIDWLKACMESTDPVYEEPYELNIDVHGSQNGPKKGRLRIMGKEPNLFNGLHFCFCDDFDLSYKGYLEELVEAAGGTLITKEMLHSRSHDAEGESSTNIVVYCLNFSQEGDPFVGKRRQEEAERLASRTRSCVVGHTWILESIASLELHPFSS